MSKVLNVFNSVNRLRERYYTAAVGKQSLIKLLNEAEVAEQVYILLMIEKSHSFQSKSRSCPIKMV